MPLTVEEKKRRRLEKKAQQLKEAEELRIKTKKDELSREVQTSQAKMAAHMKQWYIRNYQARFPLIKQDMEVAWHSFEHTVNVKDFIIDELQDSLDEAEMQKAMSWQDYMLKIEDMISNYQNKIESLEAEHQDHLKHLLQEAFQEKLLQENEQTNLEDYCKTILFIMEEQFLETSNTAQGEYVTKRDEEDKRGAHNIEVMCAALEKTLQTTVGHIKDTLQDYRDTTKVRRREVDTLKMRDDYYIDMIKRQEAKKAKLYEEMMELQSQVSESHEAKLVLEDLKKDREETYTEYSEARARLAEEARLDSSQQMTLCTESNSVLNGLERVMEKGEKILRLADLCLRLETQEEKVLTFGIPVQLKHEEHIDKEKGCCNPLDLFWRKYANANLIKSKLEPTLHNLQKENKELRECLETTFEIMSIRFGTRPTLF